jgi:hypothetical protein
MRLPGIEQTGQDVSMGSMTLRHLLEKLRMLATLSGHARAAAPVSEAEKDPLLALVGSGRELWRDEHADKYVRRMREGWG